MTMDAETLLALAADPRTIDLTPERAAELAAELTAIIAAARESAALLAFEDEPAAFLATLEALAPAAEAGE